MKKGIKKYIVFGFIYAFSIYYCVDEHLSRSLLIAVLQLFLVVCAAMIRRERFPIAKLNEYSQLPAWILVLSIALVIPFSQCNELDQDISYHTSKTRNTFRWPSEGLSQKLPDPISDYGEIWEDTDLAFRIDMYNISETRFRSYVRACKRMGFDDVNYEYEDSFSAYDEEGYDLYCWLDSYGELSVTLRSPNQLETIEWPDNDLLQLLPEPDNLYGRIDADRTGYAAVCLGNIWDSEFKEYTDQCRAAGFRRNYERKSDMYQGEDEEGNLLLLDLNSDTHTMYIQVWSAEEMARMQEDGDTAEDEEQISAESEVINARGTSSAEESADTEGDRKADPDTEAENNTESEEEVKEKAGSAAENNTASDSSETEAQEKHFGSETHKESEEKHR